MLDSIFNIISRAGRIKIFPYLVILVFSLNNCQKEKVATQEYPTLNTLDAIEIDEKGVLFRAEVVSGNLSQIKKHGFVWSLREDLSLQNSDGTYIDELMKNNSFQARVDYNLIKDKIYFFRPFVITGNYTVYGKALTFKSLGSNPPVITDFYPKIGKDLDTITITGDNFSSYAPDNYVLLNNLSLRLIECEKTKLRVVIPYNKISGLLQIRVFVSNVETKSTEYFTLSEKSIKILSVEPEKGVIAKTLFTIKGAYFGTDAGKIELSVGGRLTNILTISDTIITFILPPDHPSGNNTIIINKSSQYTGTIESISPWTKKMTLSIQTKGFNAAFTLNNKMYVHFRYPIFSQNNFYEYNPAANQLTYKAQYPGLMENKGAGFSVNGKGFIGAGRHQNESYILGLPYFYSYDPSTDIWKKASDLPNSVNGPIGALGFGISNKGYLFLGAGTSLEYYCYNSLTDWWDVMGMMWGFIGFDEWSKAAGFVINDNIFLSAGSVKNYGHDYTNYQKTWMFNVTDNKWTQLSDFPVEKDNAVGFSINGKGYIGSGSHDGQIQSDFYQYDPADNKWSRIADLPSRGVDGGVAVAINGKAYVTANNHMEIWEYDPTK